VTYVDGTQSDSGVDEAMAQGNRRNAGCTQA
jgi:hypothetical protein